MRKVRISGVIILSTISVLAILSGLYGFEFSDRAVSYDRNQSFLGDGVEVGSAYTEVVVAPSSASLDSAVSEQIMATSLANTQIDRAVIGFDGQAIMVNHSLRFYFEYFIVLQQELGRDAIIKLLAEDAQHAYPAVVADYVTALFTRYLYYLDNIANQLAVASAEDENTLSEQMRLKQALQQQWFDEVEIRALFDNQYLDSDVDNENVQAQYSDYRTQRERFPDIDPAALRMELFGMEASARFNALDQQRQLWRQKLDHYQCQRRLLDAAEGVADVDRSESLKVLRQQFFSAHEIKRVHALELRKLMPSTLSC